MPHRSSPGGGVVVGHLGSGQLALLSLADTTLLAITRRGVVPLDYVQLEDLLLGLSPKYVATRHLVYGAGDGVLMALPFDPAGREVRGGPVPVVDGVRIEEGYGFGEYDLSPDGTLVFVPGRSQRYGQIAFINPDGTLDTLPLPRGQYTQLRLSPDGRYLAVQASKAVGGWEVLVLDLETGVPQRIEVPGNYRAYPGSWTPDSRSILVGLFQAAANGFVGARLYNVATLYMHLWNSGGRHVCLCAIITIRNSYCASVISFSTTEASMGGGWRSIVVVYLMFSSRNVQVLWSTKLDRNTIRVANICTKW